jgi:transposase
MITIGIDPHKSLLTAVAVEAPGESVATMWLAVTATTVRQLQEWAARWPQRRWAVEGAEGLVRVPPRSTDTLMCGSVTLLFCVKIV